MNPNPAILTRPEAGQLRNARRVLARKGKSFNWATYLFDRRTAADVAFLYAFCRYIDDIADNESSETARDQLASIRGNLDTGTSFLPEVSAFIDLSHRIDLNLQIPRLLVDAIIADTGPVRMASWDELVRYAYGVASTVGLMMCAVMGVRDPAAHPFAVDLGIAMQLTNIARDVVEDAGRNRRYLPRDLLGDDLPPSGLLTEEPWMRGRVNRARKQVLDRADIYYRSADRGIRFIPYRGRLAVLTAARVYEAIGDRLLSPPIKWEQRAYVTVSGKIRQTLRAVGSVLLNPAYWHFGRYPDHDPVLHRALWGLPGVNGKV